MSLTTVTPTPTTLTISDLPRPVAWLRASGETSVVCSGFVIVIDDTLPGCLRILARDVPPAVVAHVLESLAIGRLTDYDEARILSDWKSRVLYTSAPVGPAAGDENFNASIHY